MGIPVRHTSAPPHFRGTSPNGKIGVEMLPDQVYAYSDDPMLQAGLADQGFQLLPPTPLASYFRELWLLRRHDQRGDVQILRWVELPDLKKPTDSFS